MTPAPADQFAELAPLGALGILDGEDRAAFEAHVGTCAGCRAERDAYDAVVVSRLGLAAGEVAPPASLRPRVVTSTAPGAAPAPPLPSLAWLGFAASLLLAVTSAGALYQRAEARREAESLRAQLSEVQGLALRRGEELAALRQDLAAATVERDQVRLVQDIALGPDARLTPLGGQGPQPGAAARILWSASRRQGILCASGLPPAPEGKAYELWVIAGAAPIPAGVFLSAADGRAVHTVALDEQAARAATFAVTLEPREGSAAPTGPMVLAGQVG